MAKANAGEGGRHGCTHSTSSAQSAFRCRLFAACRGLLFAMTDIPRPYAHMQADELAPTRSPSPRECIQTTRKLRLRKMQAKLAELIAEENRRFAQRGCLSRLPRSAGPASLLIVSVQSAAEHLHDDGLEAEYGR